MTMELSMTIALLSALAIGQFFSAIVIAFFVLFAELLEGYTVGGGRRAIEQLINALPRRQSPYFDLSQNPKAKDAAVRVPPEFQPSTHSWRRDRRPG